MICTSLIPQAWLEMNSRPAGAGVAVLGGGFLVLTACRPRQRRGRISHRPWACCAGGTWQRTRWPLEGEGARLPRKYVEPPGTELRTTAMTSAPQVPAAVDETGWTRVRPGRQAACRVFSQSRLGICPGFHIVPIVAAWDGRTNGSGQARRRRSHPPNRVTQALASDGEPGTLFSRPDGLLRPAWATGPGQRPVVSLVLL